MAYSFGKKMNQEDRKEEPPPATKSVEMPIRYTMALAIFGSLATVAIAHLLAPNHHISTTGYIVWIVAPLVLHAGLLMQNTIEGCVIVGIILALPLTLIVIKGRFLPEHIMWPGLCAVIAPWILTRICRRYGDKRPWIE
jgi:hypothetical protein